MGARAPSTGPIADGGHDSEKRIQTIVGTLSVRYGRGAFRCHHVGVFGSRRELADRSVKAWKVLATITVAGSLAACSRGEQHSTKQGAEATAPRANPEIVQVAGGQAYSVERVSRLNAAELPQNSDLKMVDGDLARYAIEGCSLDVAPQYAPTRCDVYVQPDKAGTLIGYRRIARLEIELSHAVDVLAAHNHQGSWPRSS